MQDTDDLVQETESRLSGFIETFEAEAERLRAHRTKLIQEREKTDKMLVRVERTIKSLKPEEEKPRARQAPKKAPSAPGEKVQQAKSFIVAYLEEDNHEFLTTRELREKFPEWKNGIHAVVNALTEERFLRVAGLGEKNIKQYKLTAEAIASLTEGAHLVAVAS